MLSVQFVSVFLSGWWVTWLPVGWGQGLLLPLLEIWTLRWELLTVTYVLTHWHPVTVLDHKTSTGITLGPPIQLQVNLLSTNQRGGAEDWTNGELCLPGNKICHQWPVSSPLQECRVSSETVTLIRILSTPATDIIQLNPGSSVRG